MPANVLGGKKPNLYKKEKRARERQEKKKWTYGRRDLTPSSRKKRRTTRKSESELQPLLEGRILSYREKERNPFHDHGRKRVKTAGGGPRQGKNSFPGREKRNESRHPSDKRHPSGSFLIQGKGARKGGMQR